MKSIKVIAGIILFAAIFYGSLFAYEKISARHMESEQESSAVRVIELEEQLAAQVEVEEVMLGELGASLMMAESALVLLGDKPDDVKKLLAPIHARIAQGMNPPAEETDEDIQAEVEENADL
jgi:hypothetical protein